MTFWQRVALAGVLLIVTIALGFAPMWLSGAAGTVVILGSLLASNERGWWSFSRHQAEHFRQRMEERKAPVITLLPTEYRKIRATAE